MMSIKEIEGVPGKWFTSIRVEQSQSRRATHRLRARIDRLRKAGWVVEKGMVGKYGAYWRFNAPYGVSSQQALDTFNQE